MEDTQTVIDRRVAARIDVIRPVSVATTDGQRHEGETVNVSTSGMLVAIADSLTIWSEVVAVMPGHGERAARVVRREGERYGLVFREPLAAAEFIAFTGVDIAEESPAEPVADTGPVPRIAPHAFGRDKVKTFRRIAADKARAGRP